MVLRAAIPISVPLFTLSVPDSPAPLHVLRFSGQEAVSHLFQFHFELVSENPTISGLAGKTAMMTVEGGTRFVHGMIARFEHSHEMAGRTVYLATVVPKVWRLQHRYDCRIFQDMNTPAILKKVLTDAGISSDHFRQELSGSYDPRNYCVQYRESDWHFMCRLMEEDGIFFYFEHFEDKHVLVMGDSKGACKPIPGIEKLPFRPPDGMVVEGDHVSMFRFVEEVQPGQVSLRDFNFKKPTLPMETNHEAEDDSDLEVYDFPGEYQEPGKGSPAKGATLAQIRLDEWQAQRAVGSGESDCDRLQAGAFFTLEDHARGDFNKRYLLTAVSHEGHQPQVMEEESGVGAFGYSNSFTCIPASVTYRPPRVTPRPVVRGIQTAVVVGPQGEEIYTDEFGRVKVQFHWDREGKSDEKSSCWIRVSQPWAGEKWGGMFLPRIGQEVLVGFIEGDPDRPLVTGRVYNGHNLVPYKLPDEKTKSTIKSSSSLGSEGFNELRFEDKKGKEQIFIHAQRNMDVHVLHDSMENVLHDRHLTVGAQGKNGKVGNHNELVFKDKSLKVHRHRQEHIGGDMKLLVGGVDGKGDVDVVIKGKRAEKIEKSAHLQIDGTRNEQVGGTYSLEVTKGSLQVRVKGKHALDVAEEIHLKSAKIVLEASSGLTLKVGGNFITLDAGGIAISGSMVKINSGGSALSGAGSSPEAPVAAMDAQPLAPTVADNGVVLPPHVAQKAQEPKAKKKPAAAKKTDLSPAEKKKVKETLAAQKKMLLEKKAELKKWDAAAQANFKTSFGTTSEAARKTIEQRIDKMLALNDKMTTANFVKADPSDPKTFAYVYPNDSKHTVYLDQKFWSANLTGKDSGAGTLSHEMSHFSDIGKTKDAFEDYNDGDDVYGVTESHELAKARPDLALKHADSFEYFLEGVK